MLLTLAQLRLSGHHVARDLVGTVAPFTAFLFLAWLADPDPLRPLLVGLTSLFTASPVGLFLLAIATGYTTGKVVGAVGVLVTRWATHLPFGIGQRYSYVDWYEGQRIAIEELYSQVFSGRPAFRLSLTDKVNALKSYFTVVHPQGYAEVSRQLILVDIMRAAFVYSALVLVYEVLARFPQPALTALGAVVLLVSAVATSRRLEKVVRTELVYLLAAAQLRADAAHSNTA